MLQSRRSSSYFVPLIVGHISKWWPNFELCQIFVLQAPLMSRCINTNSAHQKIFSLLCKCIYETALTLVSVTLWNSCYNISYEAPLKYHTSFIVTPWQSFPRGLPNFKIDQLRSSSLPFNSANCFSQAQLSINNWFRAILAGKMAQQDKNLLYEASSLWSIDRPTQVLIHSKRKRSHSIIICSNSASLPILYPFLFQQTQMYQKHF